MHAFNSAAIFSPGHPYIESTTILSDNVSVMHCCHCPIIFLNVRSILVYMDSVLTLGKINLSIDNIRSSRCLPPNRLLARNRLLSHHINGGDWPSRCR